MSPAIKNWQHSPPMGGWQIKFGIKGQVFHANGSPGKVVRTIANIQRKNGIFEGDAKIWEYCNEEWCSRDPARCTAGKSTNAIGIKTNIRSSVLSYLGQLKSLVQAGMKPVNQEKANERAEICVRCQYNKKTESCSACIVAARALTKVLLGKLSTVYDQRLKQCGVCGCELKAKIHYPPNQYDEYDYPEHCWVAREKIKNSVSPECG